jgi:hypothetical protein
LVCSSSSSSSFEVAGAVGHDPFYFTALKMPLQSTERSCHVADAPIDAEELRHCTELLLQLSADAVAHLSGDDNNNNNNNHNNNNLGHLSREQRDAMFVDSLNRLFQLHERMGAWLAEKPTAAGKP